MLRYKYILIYFLLFIFLCSGYIYPDTIKDKGVNNYQYFNQKYHSYNNGVIFPLSSNNFTEFKPQKLSSNIPDKKDPFIAGFLSWLMMGVGQIYCKEYTRGSIFMALDLLDKGSLIAISSYVNKKYSPKGSEIINLNWQTFNSSTKLLIIGYIIAKYGIRFYNVYDAIQTAKDYNKLHLLNTERGEFSFDLKVNSIQIGYSLQLR